MVKVLPLPVCPYAKTVALYPSTQNFEIIDLSELYIHDNGDQYAIGPYLSSHF